MPREGPSMQTSQPTTGSVPPATPRSPPICVGSKGLAAWVALLPEALQGIFTYPMLVYAAVLIVVILFRPKGIFGTYEFSLVHLRRDLKSAWRAAAARRSERKEAARHG